MKMILPRSGERASHQATEQQNLAGWPRGLPPWAPTDPDVRVSRIRLVRSTIHTHRLPSVTLRLRPQALLSVVVALTWDRVSVYPPRFPPTVG